MPDTMKVVIDYNYAKKSEKDSIDTGLFSMIFKGEEINMNAKQQRGSLGGPKLNLELVGKKWKGGGGKKRRKKK